MREKIVYILGAGFSAPMGIPVVSNFLIRSKDLFFTDPDRYGNFQRVFDTIAEMGRAKSYFSVNLFDIEEVLSILEMQDYGEKAGNRRIFKRYLRDVISACTPDTAPPPSSLPRGQWSQHLFASQMWRRYCYFVASLFNLRVTASYRHPGPVRITADVDPAPSASYAIITLNYDMIMERCLELVRGQFSRPPSIEFGFEVTSDATQFSRRGVVPLAKLHGSSADVTIVPPTWNKNAASPSVRTAWRVAYQVLSEATQIRILGYSLPATDSYIRYLLEATAMKAPHLKAFDIACLDPTGEVQERYRRLVTFFRARFGQIDIASYLQRMIEGTPVPNLRIPEGESGSVALGGLVNNAHEASPWSSLPA